MFGEANSVSYSDSLSIITIVLLLLISYGFCYFFVKKLPKGILRLISLLGVFYIHFITPWYFPSSIFLRGLASFFIAWISSFKLILFAFDKGDLILCDNFAHFLAVAAFPFRIRNKSVLYESNTHTVVETGHNEKVEMYAALYGASNLLLDNALIVLALVISMSTLTSDVMTYVFALFMVVHLGGVMMPQLEAIPVLKEPYKATSLQNFWGRRWNRVSSDILRYTIYDPTRERLEGSVGIGPGKVVALVVTLVVSGIMHEIMFYHMTCGMKPTWEVTQFFFLQGISIALEIVTKRLWVRTLGWSPVRPVVSVPLTLSFVVATTFWLMVLPVWRIAGNECDRKGLGVQLMGRFLSNLSGDR